MNNKEKLFIANIESKAIRKLSSEKNPSQGVWMGLGMMGLVGWSVTIPTLLGAGLGVWLDSKHSSTHAWTLPLLVAGLCLGCFNAWRWVAKENNEIGKEPSDE